MINSIGSYHCIDPLSGDGECPTTHRRRFLASAFPETLARKFSVLLGCRARHHNAARPAKKRLAFRAAVMHPCQCADWE
jgi:hypothetical protein